MEPFLGQLQAFGFNFAPRGWAMCNGQLLPISSNQALFSLLGTMYGGDGRTTFALPDLRGRSIVGVGAGPGLSNIRQGEKGGSENTSLAAANLPAHNHAVTIPVSTGQGGEASPANNFLASRAGGYNEDATANQNLAPGTSANTGDGTSFNNRSPYLGINVCIALQGIFPSRN